MLLYICGMKKLTHEQFLEKLYKNNEGYRNGEFEVIGKYINNRIKIKIENKYGECLVSTGNILNEAIPTIETAVDKTAYYLNKIKEVHEEGKYSYPRTIYINNSTKIIITCSEHGDFEQTPHAHLCGQGCGECKRYSRLDGRRLTTEDFIKRARVMHNDLYLYPKTAVNGNKNKVIITCKEHGDFEQSPNSHLKGRGCKKCSLENNGYNKGKFVYFAKDNKCRLYLLECQLGKEKFLKVGITSKSVEARFSGDKKLPYEYNILLEVESPDAGYIWEQEVLIKRELKKHRHNPEIKFKGYTECFNTEIKEKIMNYLKNLKDGI